MTDSKVIRGGGEVPTLFFSGIICRDRESSRQLFLINWFTRSCRLLKLFARESDWLLLLTLVKELSPANPSSAAPVLPLEINLYMTLLYFTTGCR